VTAAAIRVLAVFAAALTVVAALHVLHVAVAALATAGLTVFTVRRWRAFPGIAWRTT
jgi:hypothetical protein